MFQEQIVQVSEICGKIYNFHLAHAGLYDFHGVKNLIIGMKIGVFFQLKIKIRKEMLVDVAAFHEKIFGKIAVLAE